MLLIGPSIPTYAAANTGIGALISSGNQDEFLPPDQAFRLAASAAGPDKVQLDWIIAPGYYLYRDRMKFAIGGGAFTLGKPEFPAGDSHTDEFFGTQIVFHNAASVALAVARADTAAASLPLKVTYQGCAEAGLCYPPQTANLNISLPAGAGSSDMPTSTGEQTPAGFVSEQDRLAQLIRTGNLAAVLATFFGLGLLLAFTPCVLPMVPILSGLIAGQGSQVTTARAFSLSLTYVLGMAVTYTIAGAAFAAAGQQVQALFQQPWIVTLFAALFVAMALSMFGLFTVQMPAFIQTRLAETSNRQRAGSFGGVAVMGALSALIVTTCVAPPLIATLTVIGQSGNIGRGAAALFTMSLGMGAPLLVLGASAGRLLPRAGAWMDGVKQFFGVMMLAVAAWMLSRIVGDRIALLLYALPVIAGVVVLWRMGRGGWRRTALRIASLACGLYTVALLYGAAIDSRDPLHPLAGRSAASQSLEFRSVTTLAELDQQLAAAAADGRPVMLDFYADWCVSCKEMERYTFTDAAVKAQMGRAVLLRADVTANNEADQALLKRFAIFGPPTIAFYNPRGVEQQEFRVVGYMKAPAFAELLGKVWPADGNSGA